MTRQKKVPGGLETARVEAFALYLYHGCVRPYDNNHTRKKWDTRVSNVFHAENKKNEEGDNQAVCKLLMGFQDVSGRRVIEGGAGTVISIQSRSLSAGNSPRHLFSFYLHEGTQKERKNACFLFVFHPMLPVHEVHIPTTHGPVRYAYCSGNPPPSAVLPKSPKLHP